MGKNKNKESVKDGFYYRFRFTEQIKELDTIPQAGELLDAAEAYVRGEDFVITDKVVKMAFVSWKTQFDWDLKKSEEYHKERKEISEHANEVKKEKAEKRRKREAEQQQQPELFKEEAASKDDVPLVEAEEVEPYPFERFWNLYNFKHDKQPAEKAWKKLNNKDRAAAMAAIPNYLAYLEHKRSTGFNQNQAYAATYLNKRRWEDDYSITDTTPQNYGNNNVQYNNRLVQQQRNNEVLRNIMAEAAAAVRPRNPIETTGAGSL